MDLSLKERDRISVLRQVKDGVLSLSAGAARIGVTRRHYYDDRLLRPSSRLVPMIQGPVVAALGPHCSPSDLGSAALSHVFPLPVDARRRFPALSWLPGQTRAHDGNWLAVGNFDMSSPVSARIASAERLATPGMLSRSSMAAEKGRVASSIRASSLRMRAARWSIVASCSSSKNP